MDVGKTIRSFRELRGLTQQQVADELAISQATLSTWERNTVRVSLEDLERLFPVLKIDLLVFCSALVNQD